MEKSQHTNLDVDYVIKFKFAGIGKLRGLVEKQSTLTVNQMRQTPQLNSLNSFKS